jgi:hypothetical protein
MAFTELAKINKEKLDKQLDGKKHDELIDANINLSNTVLSAFSSLIQYLEGHTTKTEVVNQLRSIGTPDALQVIPYVIELNKTMSKLQNTDLTQVTKLMSDMLEETKKIPKTLPEQQEQQFIDYSKQFDGLKSAIEAVGKFIKAQKLIAEAPVVNVASPIVNVDAPDLKSLQTPLKDILKAVKAIVVPEFKTDNTALESLVKKSNELLKKIIDKPVSAGGGGGGVVSYVDSAGYASPVTKNADGSVPVTSLNINKFNVNNIKTVGLVTYIGMEDKDGVYCIKKIDTTTDNVFTYATITNNPTIATYTLAWAGILTNTYSIYSGAF